MRIVKMQRRAYDLQGSRSFSRYGRQEALTILCLANTPALSRNLPGQGH